MTEEGLNVFPVLLAGGSGTRLWPVSRQLYPKQLARFFGESSLIQNTIQRLFPVFRSDAIRIVCGETHAHEIERDIEAIQISPQGKVIHEPCGRNTAPAILLALLTILRSEPDALIFILPADHVIRDVPMFHDRIKSAKALAEQDHIVTFGITPTYPETGYGYIEASDVPIGEGFRLKRFVEKPDPPTARSYLEAGNFYWNSGMFAFKASTMLSEFGRFHPEMLRRMEELIGGEEPELTAARYETLDNISIDYAVMEKTDKGVVLPSDFGWSDIGSWKSLYDFLPKDPNGNVVATGDVIFQNTVNSFVMGLERLIVVNHLKDVVVVETPDSVFVSDLENSREVKRIVEQLKTEGREEFRVHTTVHHPWGYCRTLEETPRLTVKRIVLYPGAELAPAGGAGREKQWMAVEGTGEATLEGRPVRLAPPASLKIPEGTSHGISNPTDGELHIIETSRPI